MKDKKRKLGIVDFAVESIRKDPEKNEPVLGYSASGFDPLNQRSPESTDLKLYRHQKRDKRVEIVVKSTGLGVDYVGTSYSDEAAASGGMGGCGLFFVNKKTGLIQSSPAFASKTLRLLPLARASQIFDKKPESPAKIDTVEDKRQKQRELTDRYGTKTAKNKDIRAMRMRMNGDTGGEEVNQAIEVAKIDNSAVASSSSEADRNVPPYDLSATEPENAYPLDKIILKGEWDYVKDILELCQDGKEMTPDVYPSFVCNRFCKVELSQDQEEKRKLSGILTYISHLINFKNRNSLGGFSSSKHQKPLPGMLIQKFEKMFVDTDKKRISDEKIGSLISHVLVLTLFVDEFETDFTDIAKDLKMSALKLRPYFENLGCQFKRRNNVTVAKLSVPLTFPTVRKKRRRG